MKQGRTPSRRRSRHLLPALLVLAAGCGGSARGGAELSGADLYSLHGCATCHGPAGGGRSLGPPLTGLEEHWSREGLAAFVRDPAAALAAGDERLRALDERYANRMRAYPSITDEQLLRLADFLLALE